MRALVASPIIGSLALLTIIVLWPAFDASLAAPQLERLVLDPGASNDRPDCQVLADNDEACVLRFAFPALGVSEVELEGESFQALSLPGGGIGGRVGQPALPTYLRWVAVPTGKSVEVTITSTTEHRFDGWRPLPVMPDDGSVFRFDAEVYAGSAAGAEPYTPGGATGSGMVGVTVGEPASMHGLRLVPVTVRPVAYAADSGEVTVASAMEVRFSFTASNDSDDGVVAAPRGTLLPESIANLYRDTVLNGAATELAGFTIVPGSYLIICPDATNVLTALEPLIQWRSRQGYNVIVATTPQIGSKPQIINTYIHDLYENLEIPLEFVTIVGDANGPIAVPCWYESLSGYYGEGDHYYSIHDGHDDVSDVLVGRLSCRSATELEHIVAKIIGYETAPPTADPGWFQRGTLVGDRSYSGISCIYVNQWLRAQLDAVGFAEVDTIYSGNFVNQMMASINAGGSVFGYRGYWGMSGFHSGHINILSNGDKLPFAVLPTCGTGSFSADVDTRSEAFLRADNGGAIGAIGLSTPGTHTRYNNCLYNGIWDAAINGSDHRLGTALLGGKLEMINNYGANESDVVEIWCVWANLMGDPATDLWLAPPLSAEVSFPAQLPVGANAVPVTVIVDGQPLTEARVALYKAEEILVAGYTDAAGSITLPIADYSAGELLLTVTKHGVLPHQDSLILGAADLFVTLDTATIDDDDLPPSSGDGNGVANPGEVLELSCELHNVGNQTAIDVTGELSSNDPFATVVSAQSSFGDIPAGDIVGGQPFTVAIAPDAPDDHLLQLLLSASNGGESWTSLVTVPLVGAALTATSAIWGGEGGGPDPGESGSLTVTLTNTGTRDCAGGMAVLRCTSPWISVTDSVGTFAAIAVGASGSNDTDLFAFTVDEDCFPGHLASFVVELSTSDASLRLAELNLDVGYALSTDPLGPDGYGYYAFDQTDLAYAEAPVFDWIELDPRFGGNGQSVGLSDFGVFQDDTRVLDLPFTFVFYGREYDQISICSNGWVVMGATSLVPYRNWSLPNAGGPDAMIAVFWDDLIQEGDNLVYYRHDADEARLIVQWSRLNNRLGHPQNFELILYDPLLHPTESGDGDIVFQYATVNNTETGDGFATVGLQSPSGQDGLTYTYYNDYAPAAELLGNSSAIRFRALGEHPVPACSLEPAVVSLTLAPGESREEDLRITNSGAANSTLRFRIEQDDPNPPTEPASLPISGRDITGSYMEVDESTFLPGTTADYHFTVYCVSVDYEYLVGIEMDFPSGVSLNSTTSFAGGWQSFMYTGEYGDGVLATWEDGYLPIGYDAHATVNLSFGELTDPVVIPYTLFGTEYGEPPHVISAELTLQPMIPTILIQSPNGEEEWRIGETRTIAFQGLFGPTLANIELSRDGGENWEDLAQNISIATGRYDWSVDGPISAHCLVRVSDADDSSVFDTSNGEFTVGRDLSWTAIDPERGSIPASEYLDVNLLIDSAGLEPGLHEQVLLVINNAGEAIAVPVALTVSQEVGVGELLPTVLNLAQNHPNPFNPRTRIAFALPGSGGVELVVYDAAGRRVRTLLAEEMTAGYHETYWDGRDGHGRTVAAGTYFYRLVTPAGAQSRKMMLVK